MISELLFFISFRLEFKPVLQSCNMGRSIQFQTLFGDGETDSPSSRTFLCGLPSGAHPGSLMHWQSGQEFLAAIQPQLLALADETKSGHSIKHPARPLAAQSGPLSVARMQWKKPRVRNQVRILPWLAHEHGSTANRSNN